MRASSRRHSVDGSLCRASLSLSVVSTPISSKPSLKRASTRRKSIAIMNGACARAGIVSPPPPPRRKRLSLSSKTVLTELGGLECFPELPFEASPPCDDHSEGPHRPQRRLTCGSVIKPFPTITAGSTANLNDDDKDPSPRSSMAFLTDHDNSCGEYTEEMNKRIEAMNAICISAQQEGSR